MAAEADPFDDLLVLEEKFYNEGFQLGSADGEKAGRIEGRVFGLEKGFEKYLEAGRLHGRSLVWISRSENIHVSNARHTAAVPQLENGPSPPDYSPSKTPSRLPALATNARLEKHLIVLYALTEPASLSTENSEESVSDLDDRLKRAMGRVKMIERIVGEDVTHRNTGKAQDGVAKTQQNTSSGGEANIEDISILKARH